MAIKCNYCGRFASTVDGAQCAKCSQFYHRQCVKVSIDARLPDKWKCPECKKKGPRANSATTSSPPSSSGSGDAPSPVFIDALTEAAGRGRSEAENHLAKEMRIIREQLTTMVNEMVSFRQEMVKMNVNFANLNTRISDIESRVNCLEQRATDAPSQSIDPKLEQVVADLKLQINDRDQASFINDVVISGVTESKGENAEHIVLTLAQKIGVELDERDVVSASRVGAVRRESAPGAEPRAIVVRLARREHRDRLLRAARVRRTVDTSGLNVDTVPRRVYINERLTSTNRRLFLEARKLGRTRNFRFVWTREGCIYARRDSDTMRLRIRTESDLTTVFGA